MANPTAPEVGQTLVLTDTTANALVVGAAAAGATSGTGGIKSGPILSTSSITDSVGSMATIRAGGIGIASQASLDFVYAASSTQLGRLTLAAGQAPRKNAANNAWEAYDTGGLGDMTGGRLTLQTGVPVSTTDQGAATLCYYTPYAHNLISVYDGAAWQVLTFAELSITLVGATASTPYDVFVYSNAGTATLEKLAWTNTTTRATALVRQDGRYVLSGAVTRRYLGTVYVNASGGQSDDSYAKRYVWNAYNRVSRPMRVLEGTDSWSYSTATLRQANASTANQLDFVVGLPEVSATAYISATAAAGSGGLRFIVSIGLDSTTATAPGTIRGVGETNSTTQTSVYASLTTYPGIGRHTLVWLESAGPDGGTFTWYGDAGGDMSSGIDGWVEG